MNLPFGCDDFAASVSPDARRSPPVSRLRNSVFDSGIHCASPNDRTLRAALAACRRRHVRPTDHLLHVSVAHQIVRWFVAGDPSESIGPNESHESVVAEYRLHRRFRASTSRFGTGQVRDTNRTPLGLHRVARKIGTGWPVGTVFKARVPVGFVWQGQPEATIAHRILWLDGLEPGYNRGGIVDTFKRYIYIHGLADEPSLGRPASHGCVHLAAADLMPLYDRLPIGTLVWIEP